jgi:hypothetical protein
MKDAELARNSSRSKTLAKAESQARKDEEVVSLSLKDMPQLVPVLSNKVLLTVISGILL